MNRPVIVIGAGGQLFEAIGRDELPAMDVGLAPSFSVTRSTTDQERLRLAALKRARRAERQSKGMRHG